MRANCTKCEHNVSTYVTPADAEGWNASYTCADKPFKAGQRRLAARESGAYGPTTSAYPCQSRARGVRCGVCRLPFAGTSRACWPLSVANSPSSSVDERFHSY